MRIPFVLLLLAVAGASLATLASGAGIVESTLPGGLPVGNALAAAIPCALAGAAWLLSRRESLARRVSLASLFAALSWLPLSIALAGNVALNFSGGRGTLWLVLSACVGIAAMLSLAWAAVAALPRRARQRLMTEERKP